MTKKHCNVELYLWCTQLSLHTDWESCSLHCKSRWPDSFNSRTT